MPYDLNDYRKIYHIEDETAQRAKTGSKLDEYRKIYHLSAPTVSKPVKSAAPTVQLPPMSESEKLDAAYEAAQQKVKNARSEVWDSAKNILSAKGDIDKVKAETERMSALKEEATNAKAERDSVYEDYNAKRKENNKAKWKYIVALASQHQDGRQMYVGPKEDTPTVQKTRDAYEKAREDFEAVGGRDSGVVAAGLEGSIAGFDSAAATLMDLANEVVKSQRLENAADRLADKANALTEDSQAQREAMQRGRGAVGRTLVDLGIQGTQMAADSLGNVIAPWGSLASLGVRSFGGTAQEVRNEGGTAMQQVLTGAASAATEILTEKLFGGLSKIYGKGAADQLTQTIAGRLAGSRIGQNLVTLAIETAGEGVEEVISDLMSPIYSQIYKGSFKEQDTSYWKELDGGEIAYDFLIGSLMGFFGTGTSHVMNLGTPSVEEQFFRDKAQQAKEEGKSMREGFREAAAEWKNNEELQKKAADEAKAKAEKRAKELEGVAVEGVIKDLELDDQLAKIIRDDAALSGMSEAEYALGAKEAVLMGMAGANLDDVKVRSSSAKYLPNLQLMHAMRVGELSVGKAQTSTQTSTQTAAQTAQRETITDILGQGKLSNTVAARVASDPELARQFTEQTGIELNGTAHENQMAVQKAAREYAYTAGKNTETVGQANTEWAQDAAVRGSGYDSYVRGIIKSGATQADANQIISNPQMRGLWESMTGKKLPSNSKSAAKMIMQTKVGNERLNSITLPKVEAKQQTAAQQTTAKQTTVAPQRTGIVTARGIDLNTLNKMQRMAYNVISTIAKATNTNVILYSSAADSEGNFRGNSGEYTDNTILVDINAGLLNTSERGMLGKYTMLRTFTHELIHSIEFTEGYAELTRAVLEEIEKNGYDVYKLIKRKQQIYQNKGIVGADGKTFSYEDAQREVIADALADALPQSRFVQNLYDNHRSVFNDLHKRLKQFTDDLRNYYAKLTGSKLETKMLTTERDGQIQYAENIIRLFDNCLAQGAEARAQAAENGYVAMENADGEVVGAEDGKGHAQMSLSTYDESGRGQLEDFLSKRVKSGAITEAEAKDMLGQMNMLYDICEDYADKYTLFGQWSRAEVVTDPQTGNAVFSVVKANGDYAMNLDFSLVCKKRRTLDAVFNRMIEDGIMDDFNLEEKNIAAINDIIRDFDFETACALCFVDYKRYRQALVADSFVSMYNKLVRSMVKEGQNVDYFNFGGDRRFTDSGTGIDQMPDSALDFTEINRVLKEEGSKTVAYKIAKDLKENPADRRLVLRGDFMSTAGFDALNRDNKRVLSLYNAKKGVGGSKAAQSDVQYLSEILAPRKFNVDKAYAVGGVRIQSFSDYVPRLVFDYMQMFTDLGAKQLPAHAYTKEPLFTMLFGKSGCKQNMSLVPEVKDDGIAPGLDKDGNYAWRDGQSFGSTAYGCSEAYIRMCLDIIGEKYTGQSRLTAEQGYKLAVAIQNTDGYSENCGTIAVGVSKQHIQKLLRDPTIKMVIPYHKSSLNHIVAVMTNIDRFTDYTGTQNTRAWVTDADGNEVLKSIDHKKDFLYNEALRKTGDAKLAADEYLKWCERKGYVPKFDEFKDEPGYYKLLEDFSCYDKEGNAAPQGAVKLTLPGEGDPFGSFRSLIEMGLEEDAILQGKQDAAVPRIVEEIKKTIPKAEQYSQAEVRDEKITAGMSDDERANVIRNKSITAAVYSGQADSQLSNVEIRTKLDDRRKAIKYTAIAETINDGNIIPISQRFNVGNNDTRYEVREAGNYDFNADIRSMAAENGKEIKEAYRRMNYAEKPVSMTEKRFNEATAEMQYGGNKAKGYFVSIDPYDFLSLTTSNVSRFLERNPNRLNEGVSEDWGTPNNIQESGTLHLRISQDENGKWKVIGHEGRHRMAALYREGVDRVAIMLLTDKVQSDMKPVSLMKLEDQFDSSSTYIHHLIPGSAEYENAARYIFTKDYRSGIQYELREDSVGIEYGDTEAAAPELTKREYIDQIAGLKTELDYAKRKSVKAIMAAYDRGRITGIIEQGIKEQKKLENILAKKGEEKRRAVEKQLKTDAALLNRVSRAYEAKLEKEISTLQQRYEKKLANEKKAKQESLDRLRAQRDARVKAEREKANERINRLRAEKNAKIEETRQAGIEKLKQYREDRAVSEAVDKGRKKVTDTANTLTTWLLKNSDKEHIPEALKKPVADLLASIDFTSKRALGGGAATQKDLRFQSALQRIQDIITRQDDGQTLGGAYLDIDQANKELITDTLANISKAEGSYTVNEMTAEELAQLAKLLMNLKSAVSKINRALASSRGATIREMAESTIKHCGDIGTAGKGSGGKLNSFLGWKNIVPVYAFKRFGKGGETVFDGFAAGQEQLARNLRELEALTKTMFTAKEVAAWRKEVHDFTLSDKSKIQLTTAQIMELSQLMGRRQAVQHIVKGGIRIAKVDGINPGTTHYHLTTEDLRAIIGTLNAKQNAVAKGLQSVMARKGAEWGNEISMARFGYNFYDEGEHYYPIATDDASRPMRDSDIRENSMFRLLNLSSSKALDLNASNALVVGDIFSTYSQHMTDMAKLNAYGLPLLDAIKWFNYSEKVKREGDTYDIRGTKTAIEDTYGKDALRYFRTYIEDLNGVKAGADRADIGKKLVRNYKISAVGANLRVALLQGTSYVRAAYVIKPAYLRQAMRFKNGYQEALKYSGTALWKSMGYFDTDITTGFEQKIIKAGGALEQVREKSMAFANWADERTWGRLWVACKLQTKAENASLEGEALNKATAELFRKMVYETQVMDSVNTRSEIMRGTSTFDKLKTAFLAEPTLSYNVLADGVTRFALDSKRYGAKEAFQRNSEALYRSFSVYAASAMASAIVESLWDAVRDDDDYETFPQKFMQALFGEDKLREGNLWQDLTIVGKIPVIKDWLANLKGDGGSAMDMAVYVDTVAAFNIWKESVQLANGALSEPTKTTYYGNMTTWGKLYKTMKAMSEWAGLPGSNFARDAIAIWNSTVGAADPEKKLRTYDAGLKSSVRSSFINGYITEDEAVEALTAAKGEDKLTEQEAKKQVGKWQAEIDTGYAYTDLDNAYLKGKISAEELTAYLKEYGGLTDKQIKERLLGYDFEMKYGYGKDEIKGLYLDGEISTSEVKAELKFLGKSSSTIESTLLGYNFEKKYGHGSSDIKPLYLDGEISASEAKAELAFLGKTKAEIEDTMLGYDFEMKYGYGKDEIKDRYLDGKIGESEVKRDYEYLGKTELQAEDKLTDFKFEKKYGIAPGDIKSHYVDGRISESKLEEYLGFLGNNEDEIEEKVYTYNFIKQYPSATDISYSAAYKYELFAEPAGISRELFYRAWKECNSFNGEDADGDGKADYGTKNRQKAAYINSLDLTADQKSKLARALGFTVHGVQIYRQW